MNKALILTGKLVQDHEYIYPYYCVQEEGFQLDVAVRGKELVLGIIGSRIVPTKNIPEVKVASYELLISANIVKGNKISGYYSIKDDINNAGATYVDAPAVVDDRIVTSPHYKHLGDWMKATFQQVEEMQSAKASP
jgi:protease I